MGVVMRRDARLEKAMARIPGASNSTTLFTCPNSGPKIKVNNEEGSKTITSTQATEIARLTKASIIVSLRDCQVLPCFNTLEYCTIDTLRLTIHIASAIVTPMENTPTEPLPM